MVSSHFFLKYSIIVDVCFVYIAHIDSHSTVQYTSVSPVLLYLVIVREDLDILDGDILDGDILDGVTHR